MITSWLERRGAAWVPGVADVMDRSGGWLNAVSAKAPRRRPITLEGDNPSMAFADAQQHRLLELLREAGEEPVGFAELRAGGLASRPPWSPS